MTASQPISSATLPGYTPGSLSSCHDAEGTPAEPGLGISCETARRCFLKFASTIAATFMPRGRAPTETKPRIRFISRILTPYLRRAKSIEEILPWLYLKGVSMSDFSEALAALLGLEAPGLSASTIIRLADAGISLDSRMHYRFGLVGGAARQILV